MKRFRQLSGKEVTCGTAIHSGVGRRNFPFRSFKVCPFFHSFGSGDSDKTCLLYTSSGMGPRGDVILEADWCVSEFLKELDKLGLAENTIVVLTSDNGPVLEMCIRDRFSIYCLSYVSKLLTMSRLFGGKLC